MIEFLCDGPSVSQIPDQYAVSASLGFSRNPGRIRQHWLLSQSSRENTPLPFCVWKHQHKLILSEVKQTQAHPNPLWPTARHKSAKGSGKYSWDGSHTSRVSCYLSLLVICAYAAGGMTTAQCIFTPADLWQRLKTSNKYILLRPEGIFHSE